MRTIPAQLLPVHQGSGAQVLGDLTEALSFEQWLDDAAAVLEAAGSKRVALFGNGHGAVFTVLVAATRPDLVSALVITNGYARLALAPDCPWGLPPPAQARVLATVLFTDIVGSTDQAADLGDRRWHRLLDAHVELVRRELDRFRGRLVKTTGDGVLATFDGPARAIRCAGALREAARGIDVQMRVGLHTGESSCGMTTSAGSPCTSPLASWPPPGRGRSSSRAL